MPARRVRAGECIYRLTNDDTFIKSRILSNSRMYSTGAYAPMTANGKIIVDDILASCHNVVNSVPLQQTLIRCAQLIETSTRWLMKSISWTEENDGKIELPIAFDYLLPIVEYLLPKHMIEL